MMQELEKEYEIGFSRRLFGVARVGVWRLLPTNMRMRMIVFTIFLLFFAYLFASLLLNPPLS